MMANDDFVLIDYAVMQYVSIALQNLVLLKRYFSPTPFSSSFERARLGTHFNSSGSESPSYFGIFNRYIPDVNLCYFGGFCIKKNNPTDKSAHDALLCRGQVHHMTRTVPSFHVLFLLFIS